MAWFTPQSSSVPVPPHRRLRAAPSTHTQLMLEALDQACQSWRSAPITNSLVDAMKLPRWLFQPARAWALVTASMIYGICQRPSCGPHDATRVLVDRCDERLH